MDGQQKNRRVYERAVKDPPCREGPIGRAWNPMTCYILQEMSMNDVIYEQVNIIKQERKTAVGTGVYFFGRLRLVGRKNRYGKWQGGPSLWTRRGREGCLRWRLSLYRHPFIGVKRVSW